MRVICQNVLTVLEPNEAVIDYCHNVLTIDNPDYLVAKKLGKYCQKMPRVMKLYVKNANKLELPFGTLQDIYNLHNANDTFIPNFSEFKGNNMQGHIKLYDYQLKALNSLKKGKNGILEAPCGSGKTQIGLQLIKELGGRALWLTHTKKLLEQSKARCETYFKGDFGKITEGEINIGEDITFATVQTMSKIDAELYRNAFDIVVVDECHHCVGSPTKVMQFYKVINNCNCRYKFGMSATLSRADNLISTLYSIIGKKLHTITQQEVGSKRIKAEHKRIDIDIDYDPFDYISFDGTINFNDLISMLSNDESRNEFIVENVLQRFNEGTHKQLILCHRVKQVETLGNMLTDYCKVNIVTGKVKEKDRNFDADVIVATYSLAKEGLDIPTLDTLHLATPQKNASTTVQSVGRIERYVEGKQTPVCYDYVDKNIRYCENQYKKRKSIINKI